MNLYLIRHGESILNKESVYYGWTDCELSDLGIKQCEDLHIFFKDIPFDSAISSPLKRCVDSMSLITGLTIKDFTQDERLKEMNFGDWEGKRYKQIQEEFPTECEKWNSDWLGYQISNGENFNQYYNRVSEFMENVINKESCDNILIVSHQGTMRIISTILLKMPQESFWRFSFESGKYTQFEITNEYAVLRVLNG